LGETREEERRWRFQKAQAKILRSGPRADSSRSQETLGKGQGGREKDIGRMIRPLTFRPGVLESAEL